MSDINTDSLRNKIISCILDNQFSINEFTPNDVFNMFYDEYSEISIDRILYELRTEIQNTPKIVLNQIELWYNQEVESNYND
jgi:hypothetical protein